MTVLRRAVVFDLDGTLIDSAPDLHVAAARLLAELGLPPVDLDAIRSMVGEGVGRLVERLFAAARLPLSAADAERWTARFREFYLERPCVLTTLLPGARAALVRLETGGYALGLCTNKPVAHTEAILEALDIARHLPVVIGGDSLSVRKPDPAPLLAALDRLGVPAAAAVLVGDSAIDYQTARAAEVPIVLVDGGYGHEPIDTLAPDARIPTLEALPGALERLWPRRAGRGSTGTW